MFYQKLKSPQINYLIFQLKELEKKQRNRRKKIAIGTILNEMGNKKQ